MISYTFFFVVLDGLVRRIEYGHIIPRPLSRNQNPLLASCSQARLPFPHLAPAMSWYWFFDKALKHEPDVLSIIKAIAPYI